MKAKRGRQGLVPHLTGWWGHLKIKPRGGQAMEKVPDTVGSTGLDHEDIPQPEDPEESGEPESKRTGVSVNTQHPDMFIQTLEEEGLLKYSNPLGNIPVLSLCYGFLDSELTPVNWTCWDEERYKESFDSLDEEKRESYTRLFSSHYPMEALVDGLPESVWLECVEPTLTILTTINSLKRRKSNLSLKKSSMSTVDSNSACHGDFESLPFLFNPFVNGHHLRMMRIQFLALEGMLNVHGRNNQNNLHEVQAGGYPVGLGPAPNNNEVQRRRRFRQFRPYEALRHMLHDAEVEHNPGHFQERVNNMNRFENNVVNIRGR